MHELSSCDMKPPFVLGGGGAEMGLILLGGATLRLHEHECRPQPKL